MKFAPVTLGAVEQELAISIARHRHESNAANGIKTKKVASRDDYAIHLEGAGGEVAFALTWNIFPGTAIKACSSSKNGTDDGDCILFGFKIDVKTAKSGRLLAFAQKQLNVVDFYALMIGTFPTYEFRGFMAEAELLRPERIQRLRQDLPPTFVAEQSELILRLPDEELYLFHERVAIKMESGISIEAAERQARLEMKRL